MFSRPVADFQPGPDEARAGVDIAHILLAAAQGLAAQETAGWLGTSKASVDRRWALGIGAVLDGLTPG
jgi:hypothetical protein